MVGRADPPSLGVLAGSVTYQADSDAPWRYQRYYVKDPKKGLLAEAVLFLQPLEPGKSLPSGSPSRPPKTWVMDQVNFQFTPETLTLLAGDSVRFTNSDSALHNVLNPSGTDAFNVNLAQNEEYTHTFHTPASPGRPIRLGCVYHGAMRGWIYVFPHPYHAITPENGTFRMESIPAGHYVLKLHHPAGNLHWKGEVEIRDQETTSLQILLTPGNLLSPTQ